MICPFCSLLCDADDLSEVRCERREASLVEWKSIRSARIDQTQQRDLRFATAIAQAATRLRAANRILITGRVASVATARAAISFASKYSATIDCAESGHAFKNIQAIQRSGLNSVSLAEARDHSDMFIVVGNDALLTAVPRMPTILSKDTGSRRTVLLLGDFSDSSMSIWRLAGFDTWFVPCELIAIPTALAQWSEWSATNSNHSRTDGQLLDRLARAQYTTVLWSVENLPMSNADLWVERLLLWIAARNEKTRCAALPWSSFDGTFQQVCTWLTGFPGRISFQSGKPEYDPYRYSYEKWISGEPERKDIKSVLIMIDETVSPSPFLTLNKQTENLSVIELSGRSATFPTAIAGAEVSADIFRADQILLAHVLPSIEPCIDLWSVAQWLEAFSQ